MARAAAQLAAASSTTWTTATRAASLAAPSICQAAWSKLPAPLPARIVKTVGAWASGAAPQ
eukprot:5003306-Alexandrium_andersonii.AAC.1